MHTYTITHNTYSHTQLDTYIHTTCTYSHIHTHTAPPTHIDCKDVLKQKCLNILKQAANFLLLTTWKQLKDHLEVVFFFHIGASYREEALHKLKILSERTIY